MKSTKKLVFGVQSPAHASWQSVAVSVILCFSLCLNFFLLLVPGEGKSGDVAIKSDFTVASREMEVIKFCIPDYPVRGPLPWKDLHRDIKREILLNDTVKLEHSFYSNVEDDKTSGIHKEPSAFIWKTDRILRFYELAKQKLNATEPVSVYGKEADIAIFGAFDAFSVKGKDVLIVGSQNPWVEGICMAYEAKSITTVDFNPPIVEDPKMIRSIHVSELNSTSKFDAMVSYSSLEHDGLGRYGDPINPNADILRVQNLQNFLRPDGIFYLGVPVGLDKVVYNAHRVYGKVRFPLLTQGWEVLGSYGAFTWDHDKGEDFQQPIFALRLKSSANP